MFTKDSRTENFLTQMGVDFRYTNGVGFPDLVEGWDKINLARPVPLREDAIIEYATLMDGGSAAPAPILYEVIGAKKKYGVLDGLQRLSGTRLIGTTNWSAYLVSCDSDDTLAAIRVLANARLQGRAEPPEWTKRRAVEVLVVQRGLSVDEVARMGGWKIKDISRLASIIHWGAKITNVGGPDLPDNVLETLSKYLPETELTAAPQPIVEFLTTVKAARFSNSDAEPYIQEFFRRITKPSRRHRIYIERLDDFKSQPEVDTRLHGRRGAAVRRDITLGRALKSAVTILDEIIVEGVDVPNVDEFFKLIKDIGKRLQSVASNRRKTG